MGGARRAPRSVQPQAVAGLVDPAQGPSGARGAAGERAARKKAAGSQAEPPAVVGRAKSSAPLPSMVEILEAVSSLYDDRLRPFGRILRKRLAERSPLGEEVDLAELRRACLGSRSLVVTAESGGEWATLLLDRVESFVDVYDKTDGYPEELWSAADAYFQQFEGDAVLPGGRYACAHALVARQLSFLQGYTLGHVCHFVELALSSRKILGYLNGGITSYGRSLSCVKDRAAASQRSCIHAASLADMEVACWDVARKCMRSIMDDALKTPAHNVPLSSIKRIFRADFGVELSETALGHSKLSELLQDERLRDICEVRLLDQGYFVIPAFEHAPHCSNGHAAIAAKFSWADAGDEALSLDVGPVLSAGDAQESNGELGVERLQLCVSPLAMAPTSQWFEPSQRRRSRSLPAPRPECCLASPPQESTPPTPELCPLKTPDMWAGLPSSMLHSVPESCAVEAPAPAFVWGSGGEPRQLAPLPVFGVAQSCVGEWAHRPGSVEWDVFGFAPDVMFLGGDQEEAPSMDRSSSFPHLLPQAEGTLAMQPNRRPFVQISLADSLY